MVGFLLFWGGHNNCLNRSEVITASLSSPITCVTEMARKPHFIYTCEGVSVPQQPALQSGRGLLAWRELEPPRKLPFCVDGDGSNGWPRWPRAPSCSQNLCCAPRDFQCFLGLPCVARVENTDEFNVLT